MVLGLGAKPEAETAELSEDSPELVAEAGGPGEAHTGDERSEAE